MLHPFRFLPAGDPADAVASVGRIFATFDDQDSGCRSWGVEAEGGRWFVKYGPGGPARASLERALAFHRAVRHPVILGPVGAVTLGPGAANTGAANTGIANTGIANTGIAGAGIAGAEPADTGPAGVGLVVVYPWADGQVLYHPTRSQRPDRAAPDSPHARFRRLPLPTVLGALDAVGDAHLEVANHGYVAVDLYDGCLLYDFSRQRVRLCDLDEYRPGPFVLDANRLPGSSRFMAPEEFRRGATIDQRTTVFNLGRLSRILLDRRDGTGDYRGPALLRPVLERATAPAPDDRYPDVESYVAAWRSAVLTETRRSPRPR